MEAIKSLALSEEGVDKVDKLKIDMKKLFGQLEITIELYADNAKGKKTFKDINEVYEPLNPSIMSRSYNKALIKVEWDSLVSTIELQFLKIAKHVKTYDSEVRFGHSTGNKYSYSVCQKHRLIPTEQKCLEDLHAKDCSKVFSVCPVIKMYSDFYENKKE